MKHTHAHFSVQRILTIVLFFLCVGVSSLPIFHSGFFRPHDFTHAARIAEMNRSLLSGEFPVRWSENFGFGYGMPLFNFYAPLPYYIAQIPYSITNDVILSIKFLYLLNGCLAFLGMYLLSKSFWEKFWISVTDKRGECVAILSATVFTFATYRAVDLYVRGALGEVYAMVLLPFALYGVLLIQTRKRLGVIVTASALGSVLLSHNLIGMISIGIVFLFGLAAAFSSANPRSIRSLLAFLGTLLLSLSLAIGLAAFYILPAFVEKSFTRVEQSITTGYFDYHNHFLALRQFVSGNWGYGGSIPGLEDGIGFFLGVVPLVLVGASIGVVLLYLRKKEIPLQSKFIQIGAVSTVLILLCGSLFMASNRSVWVWDQIEILKYMQFPWRFLTFVHVFLALVAGGCVLLCKKYTHAVLCTIILSALIIGRHASYFQPDQYLSNLDQYYSTDPIFIRTEMSKTLNDYLPPSIIADQFPEVPTDRIELKEGDGQIHIQSNTPSKIDFQIKCLTTCDLQINIFEFPGWSITLDGKEVFLDGGNSFPISLVSLPTGTHDISVQLRDTPIREIGNLTSVATIGFLIVLFGFKRKQLEV